MLSTVTAKGQVTIPKAIRDDLDIQVNDRVSFSREGDRIVLQPVKTLKSFRGAIKVAEPSWPFTAERARAKTSVAGKLNLSEIYSFDKQHISRMENIKRIEP